MENFNRQESAPFVDLRSDAGFKAVLADRANKDILIGVLNLILPPEAKIGDILEYSDREQRRDVVYGKKTVLDLVCVDSCGKTFIVEMQTEPEDHFFERCVYYGSGLYHIELSDGNPYELLRPVYVVSFLNFRLKHKEGTVWDTDHFISYWEFEEKRTKEVADQTISVIFAEMALFTKTPEECRTELDRLFYIFKNSGGFSSIPEWISESGGVSRRLAEACEVAAFDKEKKIKYKIDKMNEWDLQAKIVYAEKKGRSEGRTEGLEEGRTEGLELGLKEGRELGREEGIEEGKELGREEGRELGREEAQLSIARKLLEAGTPVDVIATCTGLDKSVIESIAKESGSAD